MWWWPECVVDFLLWWLRTIFGGCLGDLCFSSVLSCDLCFFVRVVRTGHVCRWCYPLAGFVFVGGVVLGGLAAVSWAWAASVRYILWACLCYFLSPFCTARRHPNFPSAVLLQLGAGLLIAIGKAIAPRFARPVLGCGGLQRVIRIFVSPALELTRRYQALVFRLRGIYAVSAYTRRAIDYICCCARA